ncbi:hypothetical protein Taro_053189, partial [Colocasia esculenta]|nr:hypothetical protein [Colocasia esculenta]
IMKSLKGQSRPCFSLVSSFRGRRRSESEWERGRAGSRTRRAWLQCCGIAGNGEEVAPFAPPSPPLASCAATSPSSTSPALRAKGRRRRAPGRRGGVDIPIWC